MAPLFWGKKGFSPLYEGPKLAKTLHEVLGVLGAVILPAPKNPDEQYWQDNEEQYGLYFLACRTNMTSTLRLLKNGICYTKLLVFSLKWLGLSAGEISRLNTIAHISKKYLDLRKWIDFPRHSLMRPIIWHTQKDQIPKRHGFLPYRN